MSRLSVVNAILRHGLMPVLQLGPYPARRAARFADALSYLARVPLGVSEDHLSVSGSGGAIAIRRTTPAGSTASGAILYFHGGGYVACNTRLYRGLIGQLALRTGMPVLAPDYRLAPAAQFPAAFEDARSVWECLDDFGLSAENVILAGDSAGGGLALSLLASVCAEGTPPAGAIAFSPWTDLTLSGASFVSNKASDVIFQASKAENLVRDVVGDADRADPRLSPLFATWNAPPPVHLTVCETELLRDDALRMAQRLREAGGEVTLDMAGDAPHVLPLFHALIPEADRALDESANFARARFTAVRPPAGN